MKEEKEKDNEIDRKPESIQTRSARQQEADDVAMADDDSSSLPPRSSVATSSTPEQKERHTEQSSELRSSSSSYPDEGTVSSVPKTTLTRDQRIVDPTRSVGAVRMVGTRRMTGEEEEKVQEEDDCDGVQQQRTESATRASLSYFEAPLLEAHIVEENESGEREKPTETEQVNSDEVPRTRRFKRLSIPVVEAFPLHQWSCGQMRGKPTWIVVLLLAIIIVVTASLGIVFGLQSRGSSSTIEVNIDDMRDVGNSRESFIRDVLPDWTREKLLDPSSSQSRALDWLWYNSTFTADLPLFRKVQRFAMATALLEGSIDSNGGAFDPDSAFWQPEDGEWLSNQHECEWPQQALPSVGCRDDRLVVMDHFQEDGVFGSLAAEIALLSDLTLLDISSTRLFGTLPSTLGLLTKLEQLRLSDTNLTGKMPTELGKMMSIKRLRLNSNLLTGPIPTELALIPELEVLSLDRNMLTGTLPADLFVRGANITNLALGGNKGITGSIPTEIGYMTRLRKLNIAHCNITGSMPSELGRLTAIDVLHVYQNSELTGTIPLELKSLILMTEFLGHGTALTGPFPLCNNNLGTAAIDCTRVSCVCGCVCLTIDNHTDFIV